MENKMLIRINKKIANSIDDGKLDRFDIDMERIRYREYINIDLEKISRARVEELEKVVAKLGDTVYGAVSASFHLRQYLRLVEGSKKLDTARIKKVQHFETLLVTAMQNMERKYLYHWDDKRGVMFCSHVCEIEYVPAQRHSDWVDPEHCTFLLSWEEFGKTKSQTIRWNARDLISLTVAGALERKGYYFEDASKREDYLASVEKFRKYADGIGVQFLASGTGTDDVDSSDNGGRYWWQSNNVILDKDQEQSRVVIDVFQESDEDDERERDSGYNPSWWLERKIEKGSKNITDEMIDKAAEELPPLHPTLVIFSLKKHMRLRVHISQLEEYTYDKGMGENLILPTESKTLISTLVNYEGQFKDVVKGKGGGVIVLATGKPGTGKTLTSEVYAEVMEKPLYTVQCSQLGTEPDELEESLMKIFSRAQRWNAILLLDEADVYVSERGSNIQQNAIVGVFLRVLEYYQGVLFLTTNRADLVDDAIASRCIARIDYEYPVPEDLKKIWKVLAAIQGVNIKQGTINKLVDSYKNISGRDVKNLLKLVKLTCGDKEAMFEHFELVKKFKPTK
jgi:hypothetical protein